MEVTSSNMMMACKVRSCSADVQEKKISVGCELTNSFLDCAKLGLIVESLKIQLQLGSFDSSRNSAQVE